jgi:hypothetical protein
MFTSDVSLSDPAIAGTHGQFCRYCSAAGERRRAPEKEGQTSDPQCRGGAVDHMPRASAQHLGPADTVVWGKSQPRGEVRLGFPSVHVESHPASKQYRRLRSKLGAPKAIAAMAHRLARLVYRMLKYGQQYVDKGALYYEQRNRQQQIEFLRKKAAQTRPHTCAGLNQSSKQFLGMRSR